MKFSAFKSELEINIIVGLIFLGIRWLYRYLTASDGSTSNEELDEDKDKVEDEVKDIGPIAALPITSKVAHQVAQVAPLPQVAAEQPRLSQSASKAIKNQKISFRSKRKLFRSALLMEALMSRKHFTT